MQRIVLTSAKASSMLRRDQVGMIGVGVQSSIALLQEVEVCKCWLLTK